MRIKGIARLHSILATGKKIGGLLRQYLDAGLLKRNRLHTALAGMLLLAAVLWLNFGMEKKGPYGPYAKLPANLEVLDADAFPSGLDTRFPLTTAAFEQSPDVIAGASHTVVRQDARASAAVDGLYAFPEYQADFRHGLVRFSHGRVSVETVDGAIPVSVLRHSPVPFLATPADLFQADMFSPGVPGEPDIIPLLYGEALDESGLPSRWSQLDSDVRDADILACSLAFDPKRISLRQLVRGIAVPSGGASFGVQASRYRDAVNRYAEQYNLATSLMLAIMHTESNFNPFAVSPSRAVGLMQIVPDTAGTEVQRYLTGVAGAPSLETLFSPEHNIRYGAVYLHLLTRYYFGNINNTASRQMCIIAAYNGGPGAVLRHFAADSDSAVDKINALSPEQLYTILTTDISNLETRRYVEQVMDRMRHYSVN